MSDLIYQAADEDGAEDNSKAERSLTCLAIAPHPDDAELFCGGLLAKLVGQGHRVGVVDLSAGELASQGTPELRREEARAASEVLGLTLRENLGLPDGALDAANPEQLATLVAALRRYRPELLLAPYERERHPDHEAASALATRAAFMAGLRRYAGDDPQLPPFRPRTLLYYQMRVGFRPSFVVDISAHVATKRAAIACHASQLGRDPKAAVEGPDGPSGTLISSSDTLAFIDARDRTHGAMIGASHGEAYFCKPALSIGDPISFFRQSAEALLWPASD